MARFARSVGGRMQLRCERVDRLGLAVEAQAPRSQARPFRPSGILPYLIVGRRRRRPRSGHSRHRARAAHCRATPPQPPGAISRRPRRALGAANARASRAATAPRARRRRCGARATSRGAGAPGRRGCVRPGRPSVVVLAPDDVVLAQVRTVLHLDDDRPGAAVILDPMPCPPRDIDHLPRPEPPRPPGYDHARRATHHDPALRAKPMPLQAQATAGLHDEALDLVARALLDGLKAAPGARHEALHLDLHRCGLHGPIRTMRAKSACTAFSTSSTTSSATSSSSNSTTMARPRLVRRPTCMEAMFTLWRPRMEPILPTTPGRSS